MIQHSFIEGGPHGNLYCVEYEPENLEDVIGVVVWAPPLFDVGLKAYRVFFNCFRAMAANGYYVIYFDYSGTGNSSGSFGQLSFPAMITDMNLVRTFAQSRVSGKPVILAGFQVGSLVAASLSLQYRECPSLLVEPVLDGKKFLYKFLRSHLSSQLTVYNKITQDREQLIEIINSEGSIHVEGYEISKELWHSFAHISLEYLVSGQDIDLQILVINNDKQVPDKIEKIVSSCDNGKAVAVKKEFAWERWRNYTPDSAALENGILSLLNDNRVVLT